MPTFNPDEDLKIVEISMSDYQFLEYEKERKIERNAAKKGAMNVGVDGLYAESSSTYRIFSRAFCNFVFPESIGRPKPGGLKSENDLDAELPLDVTDEQDITDEQVSGETKGSAVVESGENPLYVANTEGVVRFKKQRGELSKS